LKYLRELVIHLFLGTKENYRNNVLIVENLFLVLKSIVTKIAWGNIYTSRVTIKF
jgi:hypothetical protein